MCACILSLLLELCVRHVLSEKSGSPDKLRSNKCYERIRERRHRTTIREALGVLSRKCKLSYLLRWVQDAFHFEEAGHVKSKIQMWQTPMDRYPLRSSSLHPLRGTLIHSGVNKETIRYANETLNTPCANPR